MRSSSRFLWPSIHTYHLVIRYPEYESHDEIDAIGRLSSYDVGREQPSFAFDRPDELRAAHVSDRLYGGIEIGEHRRVDEPRERLGVVGRDRGDHVVRGTRLFDLGERWVRVLPRPLIDEGVNDDPGEDPDREERERRDRPSLIHCARPSRRTRSAPAERTDRRPASSVGRPRR